MGDQPSGSSPPARRPAIRGGLVFDFVDGHARTRIWPSPRGPAKTNAEKERQQRFASAQRSSKYIASDTYRWAINATEKTPLLPRDVLTMMFYGTLFVAIGPDGKTRFPMQFKVQVSQSLDAISQTPGMMLIRGVEQWEPQPYVAPTVTATPGRYGMTANHIDVTGDGTDWQVVWNTTVAASPLFTLNAATGALTVLQAGVYTVEAMGEFAGSSAGDWCSCQLKVNGIAYQYRGMDAVNSPTFWPYLNTTLHLNAGDVLTTFMRVGGTTKVYDTVLGALVWQLNVTKLA